MPAAKTEVLMLRRGEMTNGKVLSRLKGAMDGICCRSPGYLLEVSAPSNTSIDLPSTVAPQDFAYVPPVQNSPSERSFFAYTSSHQPPAITHSSRYNARAFSSKPSSIASSSSLTASTTKAVSYPASICSSSATSTYSGSRKATRALYEYPIRDRYGRVIDKGKRKMVWAEDEDVGRTTGKAHAVGGAHMMNYPRSGARSWNHDVSRKYAVDEFAPGPSSAASPARARHDSMDLDSPEPEAEVKLSPGGEALKRAMGKSLAKEQAKRRKKDFLKRIFKDMKHPQFDGKATWDSWKSILGKRKAE
ncbi:hypothetical protein BDW02DRAFT_648262 [Decorospora gaudefroyi]|uniref:Uncharacterized protein n=1 Tax=Decorospora gaudefroyi TaxID=184978 RepID=A0A6A5KBV3_9PLEO|nr:hypothetical protein BDW02DRAFT_648262 [Decorospora gaudefroyi]